MNDSRAEPSPKILARLGGVLYLIVIVGGLLGEAFIRGRLIVAGDPIATAERIRASELLWRVGAAGEIVMLAVSVGLALILYRLLRPVNRDLALLAVFFNLLAIGLEAVNELNLLAALSPLAGGQQALAFLPIEAYGNGWAVGLIFFGVELLIVGHLISRARYLPGTLGRVCQAGGLSYLVNSFALLISPSLADRLLPLILVPAFVAELSVALWLLVKGVDEVRWDEPVKAESIARSLQNSASGYSPPV